MLSRFSHVSLFVTLWTVARLAPLSIGFSRQEHWSGLPCPPPGNLPYPEIKTRSTLQVYSLPSEPPGKPKNTGVGSLTLLQGIFQTQELNQGLLPCRQILYQQSQEQYPLIQESISLFALLRLSTDWRRPGLGRAICFIHSTDSHVSLIQKHPYGNTQNNV